MRTSLVVLAVAGAIAVGFWKPIQRSLTVTFLLGGETPAQPVVGALADEYTDPTGFLSDLWDIQKIPHRRRAITGLERQLRLRSLRTECYERLLLDAAVDPDLEVRRIALSLLAAQQHPWAAELAARQLQDPDPAVRVLGIQSLGKVGNQDWIAEVAPLLRDGDPRVVASAGIALQRWIRQDFGFRLHLALPRFEDLNVRSPSDGQMASLSHAVQGFQSWQEAQSGERFIRDRNPALDAGSPMGLRVPECEFKDLDGSPVTMSDFKGKALALAFWDTSHPGALDCSRPLAELQSRYPQDLALLAVSLDATISDRSHEHAHAHHPHSVEASDPDTVRTTVQRSLQNRPVPYRVLIDPKGDAARRFDVQTIPTFVLVDGNGSIHRVMVGPRPGFAWLPMVEALIASQHRRE